jgi:Helitron helicase-like domain at N-terminus
VKKFQDPRLCHHPIPDPSIQNDQTLGQFCEPLYMRNEIWSLIAYLGAPVWYITLSPADNKHPICLYFADNNEKLDVTLSRSEDERYRLIASNPVAGARFFSLYDQNVYPPRVGD